jgi:hypothetical protein
MCVDVMGCGGQTKQRGPGGPKKADTGLVDLTTDKQVSGEGGMGRDKGERRGVYHGGNSRRAGASEGPHLVRLTRAYTQRQNIHLSMAFALIQVCCLPVISPLYAQEVEYHVRWSGRAYWHCSWVPESFLAKHAKVRLKNFKARQVGQADDNM